MKQITFLNEKISAENYPMPDLMPPSLGFIEFPAHFKLTFSSSEKPKIRDTDREIWRRFLIVPELDA